MFLPLQKVVGYLLVVDLVRHPRSCVWCTPKRRKQSFTFEKRKQKRKEDLYWFGSKENANWNASIIFWLFISNLTTTKAAKFREKMKSMSALKSTYLGQFLSNLSKLGLKIWVKVFLIEIKKNFDDWTKAFCSVINQACYLLWGHPV